MAVLPLSCTLSVTFAVSYSKTYAADTQEDTFKRPPPTAETLGYGDMLETHCSYKTLGAVVSELF